MPSTVTVSEGDSAAELPVQELTQATDSPKRKRKPKAVSNLPATHLSADDCGARYSFSGKHWRRLVDAGNAPQPVRFGGKLVRWAVSVLEEWEKAGCPAVRTVSISKRATA